MKRYVALLRGVNVGGKNKIPMTALMAAYKAVGFTGVSTYINSGNVLFTSETDDAGDIQKRCEAAAYEAAGITIPVAVFAAEEYTEAIVHAPAWWGTDGGAKHNALFIIAPHTAEEIFAQVGALRPEYEKTAHYGRVIFWSAATETFSRTGMSKLNKLPAYGYVTVRNANTACKINQLLTLPSPALP